jgi:peptidoglycan/LPS O-acetylase OafA/YrhL
MTEPRRNPAIDLLRASSILYIVGYWHLLGYIDGVHGYKNAFTYRLTVVVLGLFTLMAGALAGRRPIRCAREVWGYYRARALRILPPYALALVLFALTDLLLWRDVGRGLLLIPAFDGHPLRTLWYVNMLVLFYGLAPLLLLLRGRLAPLAGNRLAGFLPAAALALLLWGSGGGIDPRLGLYFPAFATGLLLSADLLPADGGQPQGPLIRLGPLAVIAAAAIAFSLPIPGRRLDSSLHALPLVTLVPLLILVVASRWLQGRTIPGWLRATSTASYFIYLLHRPLFLELKAAAAGMAVVNPGWLLVYLLLFGVPVISWISWGGQWLYDRSLRALGV